MNKKIKIGSIIKCNTDRYEKYYESMQYISGIDKKYFKNVKKDDLFVVYDFPSEIPDAIVIHPINKETSIYLNAEKIIVKYYESNFIVFEGELNENIG